MNSHTLVGSRVALHGVAELVLAGPQYAATHDIRLRVTPGGFGTVTTPGIRLERLDLVTATTRIPLGGTFAGLARAAGTQARPLRDVYDVGPDVDPDDPVVVDPAAVDLLLAAFADGDAALRRFAPDLEPVLWPEHFDLGITVGGVDYGVSPGDTHLVEPYAYVGPSTPRSGSFWNTEFGAARPLTELSDVDAIVTFFEEGTRLAGAPAP